MVQPQPPHQHYPPYPVPPPYGPPPVVRRRSQADIVVTIVLSIVALSEGAVAFFATGFFAMAGDVCPNCNETKIGLGFLVSWGGLALTALGTLLGIVISARRGRLMWVWPALAMVAIVVFFIGGALLANSGMHR